MKEFTAAVLDWEHEVFIVHVAALSVDLNDEVYLSKKAQIAHLKADEVSIKVPSWYADFTDVFSPNLATELFEYMRINDHAFELVDNEQLLYGPINSLGSLELETLKAYTKNNLVNGFIKSLARVLILFKWKLDGSLKLCVDYRGLNNLTIKNRYPLPLIEELLD